MISGAGLAQWLEDPQRQRASGEAADRLAEKWRHHPLFTDLEAALAANEPKTSAAVLQAAEQFMAREDEIAELVRDLIAASAADPFFRPPFLTIASDINTGFLLFGDPDLTIALGVIGADALAAKKSGERGATSIGFTGLDTVFHWLKAGEATLSFWEADPAGPDFVGTDSAFCRRVGQRRIEDGERFLLDGRRQSFVMEHASSDMICLQAAILAGAGPLAVEYDSKSLAFAGASSTDEVSSRTQMMVSLLRLMDRADAIPDIEGLLESPHFYTRWHIMREFLAMDPATALPHLQRLAADDPHPEVRDAARQTLELFFGHEEAA
jgi:HEAT repeats